MDHEAQRLILVYEDDSFQEVGRGAYMPIYNAILEMKGNDNA